MSSSIASMLKIDNTHIANSVDLSFMNYEASTRPSALTLLFLHGSSSNKDTWKPCLDLFKEKYNIIALDLRGHGESPLGNADFSIAQVIADIERLVKTKKMDKFVMVAHSMGVRIAVPYAYQHAEQIEALILEDYDLIPEGEREINEHLKKFKATHATQEEARQEVLNCGYTEDRFESWLRQGHVKQIGDQVHIRVNPYAFRLAFNGIATSDKPGKVFKALQTPLLLLQAEKNSSLSDEGLKQMLQMQPTLKYIKIPHSEHSIHRVQPKLFATAVHEFLETLALTTS